MNSENSSNLITDDPACEERVETAENAELTEVGETCSNCVTDGENTEDKPCGGSEKASTELSAPAKKKHGWVWNLVLVAIIALGVFCLFKVSGEITAEDGKSFAAVIGGVDWVYAVVLLCVVIGVIALDSLKFCFIDKAVTGKFRVGTAIKNNLLGKYYDAVTPFSTGGQPMQIYYLTTKGISGGNASAIVLIRYFSSIFCWLTVGAVCMAVGAAKGVLDGVSGKNLLLIAGWVGLGVNLIIPFFILSFIIFPKMAHKLTTCFIGAGVKLKIVKNRDKAMDKALKTVNDFVSSFGIMVRRPLWLVLLILACFAEVTLTFSVPFFVMKALSCNVDGMFFTVMSLNVFTTFGVSFIPTPGNSGVVESMGVLAFSFAAGATLAWSVLFWRFSVYYIYIVIGLALTVFDLIIKNVRAKRAKNG